MWVWIFFVPFFFGFFSLFCSVYLGKESMVFQFDILVFREAGFQVFFLVDSFSLVFTSMVGFVSGFVLFYSNFYMEGLILKKKFINTLVVFVISMVVLSMSADLFWVMIGWDGLGFSSLCLIFFFQNWKSFNSSLVTFISNRIGDFFIISFFCFFFLLYGGLNCEVVFSNFVLGVFFCLGAFSKSAQIPFSSWLPLAMAAPTPVSSLVHSSTLVTAGVYLFVRFKSFLSEDLRKVIFFTSFVTIFLAGSSSLGEFDLKKVIALSTLSHVGLMMMFIGMGSFVSAKIHLVVHSFFKSLLFMISGLIIHSNGGFQDIRTIFLSSKNSFFCMSFLFSIFSMMGVPFFSGFYSKEILLGWLYGSMDSLVEMVLFFFSVLFTCSYSIRLIVYFFFPFSSCVSFFLKCEALEFFFFFMTVFSSFVSGLIVFILLGEEKELYSVFSFSQKAFLYSFMFFGFLIGGVVSFFIFSFFKEVKVFLKMMWMVGSVNLVVQDFFFNLSFFFFSKSDIKGMIDFFFLNSLSSFKFFSKGFLFYFCLNSLFFLKVCSILGLVIFMFF